MSALVGACMSFRGAQFQLRSKMEENYRERDLNSTAFLSREEAHFSSWLLGAAVQKPLNCKTFFFFRDPYWALFQQANAMSARSAIAHSLVHRDTRWQRWIILTEICLLWHFICFLCPSLQITGPLPGFKRIKENKNRAARLLDSFSCLFTFSSYYSASLIFDGWFSLFSFCWFKLNIFQKLISPVCMVSRR